MKKSLLIMLLSFLHLSSFSQRLNKDTLYLNNLQVFENELSLELMMYVEMLNPTIKCKIDSVLSRILLLDETFFFESCLFKIKLDSCGYIESCNFLEKNTSKLVTDFAIAVEKIIVESKWRIPTIVCLPNNALDYFEFPLSLYYDADLKQIECPEYDLRFFDTSLIHAIHNNNAVIYFNGLNFGCD